MQLLLDVPVAAAVFDMDGVITDTREHHFDAWARLFDAELPQLVGDRRPFTAADYDLHVDGRSREAGIRTLLAARGLPEAEISAELVARLSARKQELFEELVRTRGVVLLPGAADLVRTLRTDGVRIGLATASRNARLVLHGTGILPLVDVVVDGTDVQERGLRSKPAPDLFLETCRRLEAPPARTLLVEDSVAGVEAATTAGFALVVGTTTDSRRAAALRLAGADAVVGGLDGVEAAGSGLVARTGAPEPWVLGFDGYDPAAETTRESLCTLTNGYWGVRGAAEEARTGATHAPGTYFAGLYDSVDDGPVAAEELVNAPSWLPLLFRVGDGPWFSADRAHLLDFHQELDLRHGVLRRRLTVRDAAGRETAVRYRRFLSLAEPRLGAVEVTIVPANWSGPITIRSGIDTGARNSSTDTPTIGPSSRGRRHVGVRARRELSADTIVVDGGTLASDVRLALVERTRLYRGEAPALAPSVFLSRGSVVCHEVTVELALGERLVVEKVAGVSTSRDRAARAPSREAAAVVARAPRFAELLAEHARAWDRLWAVSAVGIRPEGRHSLAVNVNAFHVLQTLAGMGDDLDAGVPARGLHGEAYGGHIFWDELFVYPFLTLRRPEVSRTLLRYRFRRLSEAEIAAAGAGHRGAMFPWQSATTGEDVTPDRLFNPLTGGWMPDHSHLQRHVGLGVAYSAWQFYQTTGDAEYLAEEGGALIVGVARFFASLAEWDPVSERYSIRGVMGPDEFHDGPPGRPGAGLTDNVYTNAMTAWVLLRAADTVRLLTSRPDSTAADALGVSEEERDQWTHIARLLRIVFNADGTLSQFDGYDALEPIDLERYRTRYPTSGRLDLVLESEGDSANRYQVSKQPDCLMLLYLFSAEELRELFRHLGYALEADVIVRTVERYSRSSTYGSTLSNVVHSWIEARRDRTRSWQFLERALQSDLADIQGGTTRHGVHLAAMAGSVDLLTRCYPGLETRADMLWFHPSLPVELDSLELTIIYRAHRLTVSITHDLLRIASAAGYADPVRIVVDGQPGLIHAGETRTFEL
jgi:beta-phosphoglucomutase family hydrolase